MNGSLTERRTGVRRLLLDDYVEQVVAYVMGLELVPAFLLHCL